MKGQVILAAAAVLTSVPTLAADDATATVVRLYRDFGWETLIVEPHLPGVIDQPRATLTQYFDGHLADLILKDRECVRKTHEICALDFMPMWDAQDVGATDLEIKSTGDPAVVEVRFKFAGNAATTKLSYRLSHSNSGWRIRDIQGSEWSLLSILEKSP